MWHNSTTISHLQLSFSCFVEECKSTSDISHNLLLFIKINGTTINNFEIFYDKIQHLLSCVCWWVGSTFVSLFSWRWFSIRSIWCFLCLTRSNLVAVLVCWWLFLFFFVFCRFCGSRIGIYLIVQIHFISILWSLKL